MKYLLIETIYADGEHKKRLMSQTEWDMVYHPKAYAATGERLITEIVLTELDEETLIAQLSHPSPQD